MSGPSWVPTEAGAHLRGRTTRDTAPERRLRSELHRAGLRFRLHRLVAAGCTPDLVLPRTRVAVFVDGCYWHGCPVHGTREFRGPNAALWSTKIERNRARDVRTTADAMAAGWTVVRLWECQIRRDVTSAVELVRAAAGREDTLPTRRRRS